MEFKLGYLGRLSKHLASRKIMGIRCSQDLLIGRAAIFFSDYLKRMGDVPRREQLLSRYRKYLWKTDIPVVRISDDYVSIWESELDEVVRKYGNNIVLEESEGVIEKGNSIVLSDIFVKYEDHEYVFDYNLIRDAYSEGMSILMGDGCPRLTDGIFSKTLSTKKHYRPRLVIRGVRTEKESHVEVQDIVVTINPEYRPLEESPSIKTIQSEKIEVKPVSRLVQPTDIQFRMQVEKEGLEYPQWLEYKSGFLRYTKDVYDIEGKLYYIPSVQKDYEFMELDGDKAVFSKRSGDYYIKVKLPYKDVTYSIVLEDKNGGTRVIILDYSAEKAIPEAVNKKITI